MMGKTFCVSLVSLIALFDLSTAQNNLQCYDQNPCGCRINDFEKIDISNLINSDQKFLEDSYSNLTYYFVGCKDIKLTINNLTSPSIGSLFLYNVTKPNATLEVVGNTTDIQYDYLDNNYELHYKQSNSLTATMILVCNTFKLPFIKLLDIKEDKPMLALSSPAACIIKEKHGYSTGSVLVIMFVMACLIYFIGGALVLYFLRGARGIELIPNVDFWRQLPGLIKDGLVFLLSGCRASSIETYDRI